MTYCIAIRLDQGLVFLSDSRTNAGVDAVSNFRKMAIFKNEGDRVMVLMSAGNLAITQAVRHHLNHPEPDSPSIWNSSTLFEAAQVVGDIVRKVRDRDAEELKKSGIEFNINLIFGGQIKGQAPSIFQVYAAGNFIEATVETPYFQIGEAKYGKPILDRVITQETPLKEAAKCALISMDSTIKSNISVGLPLDLLIYPKDDLKTDHLLVIDEKNEYFKMIHETWGKRLRQIFSEIEDPVW
jgi:putative proteasome-type protease